VRAHDQRIGRDVAIKRMRDASNEPHAVARFLREARIQARLDHPAIVPVYELGVDEAGRPFFTMKRIGGTTLHDHLGKPGPIQPALRAFVDVCMAVGQAHQAGIVHRDLKPANIMLGDYNEVYVLDWGVARVLADEPAGQPRDIVTLDEGGETAGMLGTPGYMAPEQIEVAEITPGTDVYALGAILFEILAGEPLHPRGGALASTLETPQDSAARRRPDRNIALELDDACFAALAKAPRARPSARELGARVQAYLDGDRDLEGRRALSAKHLVKAQVAAESDNPDARAVAIRECSRALILDADSRDAATLMMNLMFEPPRLIPPALQKSFDDEERTFSSERSRTAMFVYLSVFSFLAAIPFMTVRSWPWLLALNAVLLALVGITWWSSRTGRVSVPLAMVVNLALVIVWSRLAGPLMLTPILVCGVMIGLSVNPALIGRKWALIAWGVLASTTPILLEALGVLEQTWSVDRGMVLVRSVIFDSPGTIDAAVLIAANTVFVATIGLYVAATARQAHEAKRRIHLQKWHLEQMLP